MQVFKNDRENLLLKSKDELIDLLIAVEEIKQKYYEMIPEQWKSETKDYFNQKFEKYHKESKIIIRHAAPNKHDHAPFGTSCKVVSESGDSFQLYVQYGKSENDPDWQHMGIFNGDDINKHLCDKLDK